MRKSNDSDFILSLLTKYIITSIHLPRKNISNKSLLALCTAKIQILPKRCIELNIYNIIGAKINISSNVLMTWSTVTLTTRIRLQSTANFCCKIVTYEHSITGLSRCSARIIRWPIVLLISKVTHCLYESGYNELLLISVISVIVFQLKLQLKLLLITFFSYSFS